MKRRICIALSISLLPAACLQAAVLYSDDFSSYAAGTSIAGANWDPKWEAGTDQQDLMTGSGNVGGSYYGVLSGLAKFNYNIPCQTPFTVTSPDKVVVRSDFRYNHLSGGNTTNVNQSAFGLLLSTTPAWNTGTDKTAPFTNRGSAMGMKLPLSPWQEGWVTHSSLGVDTAAGGLSDWFTLESTLTASNSTIWIKTDMLGISGTVLVNGTLWDTGLADTTTLYAGYSTAWNNTGLNLQDMARFSEVHVDNFQIESLPLNVVPPTNQVSVTADLTRQLFIGGVSTFNRDQFINWHTSGSSSEFSASEAAAMFDVNKTYVGRSVGGMQWIRKQVPQEDPSRPGYVDVAALTTYCQNNQDAPVNDWPWQKGRYQSFVETDHTQIFPGQSTPGYFNPTNYAAAAEWASVVWSNKWTDPVRPRYYEPINEPFVHATAMGTTPQGIVDFYEAMIDRLHADVPALQVGGPCSAYPVFSLNNYDHFRQRVGLYIDQVGLKTDFISWHIYSTFVDGQDLEPDSVGANSDWQLDLVENYAKNQTGRDIPIVISEYGGGYKNHESSPQWSTYSPERDWHILKSVMGKTMTFNERPDRIAKAIPFISGKATWYAGYQTDPENTPYPFVAYRKVAGVWQPTHLKKFYDFWRNVEGDHFPVSTSDPDLQAHLFVTNNLASLCLHNADYTETSVLDISALLGSGVSVQSASMTHLYFDGTTPILDELVPLVQWTNVTLEPESSAIIHLTLNQAPDRSLQLYRKSHYGDRTMIAYTGTPETFTVNADMNRGPIHSAVLKVGVTRSHSASKTPLVTFNGQALPQATDWPGGLQADRSQFDGTIRMNVPSNLVQAVNTIDVSFDTTGGFISTVILDVDSEMPFAANAWVNTDTASGMIMGWESSEALNYIITKSTNLVTGPWSTIGTLPGNGGTLHYTNSITGPNAFYQLKAQIQ